MPRPDEAPTDDMADIDTRVAAIYGGPLTEFVAQRDALARTLRSAGKRAEASEVKALKKPKAVAWALDAGGHADPAAVSEVAAAVAAVEAAQADGGDVREALARLRAAESALVDAARGAAHSLDHPVDQTLLASALRAVVGDPESLAALRAGRLVDAPAAGGFGTSPAASTPVTRASRPNRGRAAPRADGEPAPTETDAAAIAAARRAVSAAERAARAATNTARKAAHAAAAAERKASDASEQAAAAQRRADEAEQVAQRARSDADARSRAAEDAAADLKAANEALRTLGGDR